MTAPADEGDFVEIESELQDGVWVVEATLGQTTILVQTHRDDVESLPVLVNSLTTILETAWAAIEPQLSKEDA